MNPAIKCAELNGITLEYADYALENAPVLVLTHGLCSTKELFDAIIPDLANTHRVLTLDLRGHGHSTRLQGPYTFQQLVADVKAVLDLEGIERASFGAASFSAGAIQMFAAQYPERVDKLILFDGGYFDPSARPGFNLEAFQSYELPVLENEEAVQASIAGNYKSFLNDTVRNTLGMEFERQEDGTYRFKIPTEAFRSYVKEYASVDYDTVYRDLTCPVLVLVADDPHRPQEMSDFYLNNAKAYPEKVKNAHVAVIPHSHHALMVTNPQACLEQILPFLNS